MTKDCTSSYVDSDMVWTVYSRERGQPVSVAGPPSLCIEVKGAARACGGIARRKGVGG